MLFNKRAISIPLSALILTAGVIAAGIAILYWAYSWGGVANQQYSDAMSASMSAIQERIAFEYIAYSNVTQNLTAYIINCGQSNNVNITRAYIWDNTFSPLPNYPVSPLYNITTPSETIPGGLNIGDDGYFNITIPGGLGSGGSYYTIRVVTQRGRNFDETFSP